MLSASVKPHIRHMKLSLELVCANCHADSHLILTAAQAANALLKDEVPCGCVFVHNGNVIAKGMNNTNESLCVRVTSLSCLLATGLP